MDNYNAPYGWGDHRAVQNNQANVVKFVFECLNGMIIENKVNNESSYSFYENHSQYGQPFEVKKNDDFVCID